MAPLMHIATSNNEALATYTTTKLSPEALATYTTTHISLEALATSTMTHISPDALGIFKHPNAFLQHRCLFFKCNSR